MGYEPKISLSDNLKCYDLSHKELNDTDGHSFGAREIIKDGKVIFIGNWEEVKNFLIKYEDICRNCKDFVQDETVVNGICAKTDKPNHIDDECTYRISPSVAYAYSMVK